MPNDMQSPVTESNTEKTTKTHAIDISSLQRQANVHRLEDEKIQIEWGRYVLGEIPALGGAGKRAQEKLAHLSKL